MRRAAWHRRSAIHEPEDAGAGLGSEMADGRAFACATLTPGRRFSHGYGRGEDLGRGPCSRECWMVWSRAWWTRLRTRRHVSGVEDVAEIRVARASARLRGERRGLRGAHGRRGACDRQGGAAPDPPPRAARGQRDRPCRSRDRAGGTTPPGRRPCSRRARRARPRLTGAGRAEGHRHAAVARPIACSISARRARASSWRSRTVHAAAPHATLTASPIACGGIPGQRSGA